MPLLFLQLIFKVSSVLRHYVAHFRTSFETREQIISLLAPASGMENLTLRQNNFGKKYF